MLRVAKDGGVVDHHRLARVKQRACAAETEQRAAPGGMGEHSLFPDVPRAGQAAYGDGRQVKRGGVAGRQQHIVGGVRAAIQGAQDLTPIALYAADWLGQEAPVQIDRLRPRQGGAR